MSQYAPFRKRATSAQSHGSYYHVPEELKALLVDLTVSLLQHQDADTQQIYTLAAQFLEQRLNERNSNSQSQKHDQNENIKQPLVVSVPQKIPIQPTSSNDKISEFADRESKDIINNAICDYLVSGNLSHQEDVSNQRFGGIYTDALGNIDLTNMHENLEHPVTIEELSLCKSRNHEKESSFKTGGTQSAAHKNVYESLEHPVTLSELQTIVGSKSDAILLQDYLHIYQNYAEKSCTELMKLVYEDVIVKLGSTY